MSTENFQNNKPLGTYSAFNTFYTYSWVNNEQFYALVPYPYKEYYQRFIKQWFYWYDGFVPHFHNTSSGMFSTRLAYTVLHKLAQQTVGNKLMFNDDGVEDDTTIDYKGKELNSLEFIEKWSELNHLDTKTVQGTEWAFAGGDSVIKVDGIGGELIPSIVRKDNYLIDTDFKGEICKFQSYIYNYTKMIQGNDDSTKEYYYLLEEREMIDDKPMFRLSIKRGNGNAVTNKPVNNVIETVPFDRLPRDISHKFKKDYPNVMLGEWKELPIKDLGVYLIKASERVSFLPNMVGGESLLSNAIHVLMSYDYYFSSLNGNLYTARDKLILPQHMKPPQAIDDPYFGQNNYSGFDSYTMARIPYTNPEDAKPILWQPDTRADQWLQIRDNLLQTFAMVIGVDERSISSAIVPNAEKPTAREISSDEHTTTLFIEGKQRLIKNALDKLIECVLDFYGFDDEIITVKFNKSGLSNMNNVTTITTLLKQNSLIDNKTALEMIFKDKNNKQIEDILNAIEKQEEKALGMEQIKQQETDVEEKDEQQNNQDTSHVPKPKKKFLDKFKK